MKIYLNGGLGNQLFQYAYLFNYRTQFTNLPLEFITDGFVGRDQKCEIEELFEPFSSKSLTPAQDEVTKIKFPGYYRLREVLIPPLRNGMVPNHIGTELHEKSQFSYYDPVAKWSYANQPIRGYFQHWRYVENAWPIISVNITAKAKRIFENSNMQQHLENSTVIHIRGGDYRGFKNTWGILGSDYYNKALNSILKVEDSFARVLVLTNDIELAKSIVGNIKYFEFNIIGPENCTAWEALSLMASAKNLVAANSTLSWWGAFLAAKNGGTSYIPSPWFRNTANATTAMKHPIFETISSSWRLEL